MQPTVDLDELRGILDRVQEWTRAADQKVAALMAAAAVSGALLAPALPEWFTINTLDAFRVPIAVSIVLWFVSIGASTAAVFARTKNPHARRSVSFFGDIANTTVEEYRSSVGALSAGALRDDYVDQIHVCSKICGTKHWCVKWATGSFIASISLIILCYAFRGLVV